jgi:hypothetical protein
MSTVNVNRIVDTSGGVLAPISSVFRSRIINGAMMIDQRNAGASVTPSGSTYTLDRWRFGCPSAKMSVQQNAGAVTPPNGFKNYIGLTTTSAYTPSSTEAFTLAQFIEGNNVADLMFGTAAAQTVTLSFWVRSSLTGTFGAAFDNDNGGNRSYPFTYTIYAANTWEYKTITVTGDTSGTWGTGTGAGLGVVFSLGVGSNFNGTNGAWQAGDYRSVTGATSVVGTSGATFYITGVQLEKGSTATSFDYRPYGTELQLCQRYCEVVKPSGATNYAQMGVGAAISTTGASTVYFYQVAKRSQPTVTYSAANTFATTSSTDSALALTSISTDRSDVTCLAMALTVASGLSAGNATRLLQNNAASSQITISAEL